MYVLVSCLTIVAFEMPVLYFVVHGANTELNYFQTAAACLPNVLRVKKGFYISRFDNQPSYDMELLKAT